ncbi:MAG: hypothetical protein KIH44_010875 [Octadecabacter sp.]|nr:hypothetical protein [Octadecabacter sp.]
MMVAFGITAAFAGVATAFAVLTGFVFNAAGADFAADFGVFCAFFVAVFVPLVAISVSDRAHEIVPALEIIAVIRFYSHWNNKEKFGVWREY